jgi:hypothetical protein
MSIISGSAVRKTGNSWPPSAHRTTHSSPVTNNRSDFLALHGQEPLHAEVIIIVPSVTPARQRELFSAALEHVGARDLTNTVVEVEYAGNRIVCSEYALPEAAE